MPPTITARFYVASVLRQSYNPEHAQIVLTPAYADGANKAWAEATPSGKIELTVNNPSAAQWFEDRMRAKDDLHLEFSIVDKAAEAAA